MHATDDDFSPSPSASCDRTFGADRHDLRPLIADLDGPRPGLMGRAAHAMRRILGRSGEAQANPYASRDWMRDRLAATRND